MNKKLSLLLLVLLSSCTKFDDYMLGKDNTPAPKHLTMLNTKASLAKQWTVSLGKSQKNTAYLRLKPLLSGNRIYVAGLSGQFDAINAKSGKVIWAHKTAYGFVSGPTLGSGMLFLATTKAQIVAFRQSDGKEVWRQKLSGEALASPIIVNNQVIAKTIDGNLYSFNVQNGKKSWYLEHGSPSLVLKASSSPVLLNSQTALVGYSDGKLDAVNIDSGHIVWQRSIVYATGSSDVERLVDIDADPIILGNTVFLGSYQGSVGAISLADGQFIWRKPASIYNNMTLTNGALYYADSNDVLWSRASGDGHVNWKQPALKARKLTEPVVAGRWLFVGDKTGLLHVVDTESGELIARESVRAGMYVAPLVSGGRIYVLTTSNELSCYTMSS